MGILANTGKFIAKKTVKAAEKVGDAIATLSSLSPKQIKEVDEKREKYLSGKPDAVGEEAQKIIQRQMGAVGIEVYQAYLEQLNNIYLPVNTIDDNFDSDNRIRYFEIKKWVFDSEEKSLDKLVNVYHVLSEEDCNIALIYHRTTKECSVSLGVVNTSDYESDPAIADNYYERIKSAMNGNFPGADIEGINEGNDFGVGIPNILEDATKKISLDGKTKSVAVVSNVASEKSEDFISQNIEKILDGVIPKNQQEEYSIILLAKPVRDQLESKNRLYELYSCLSPYSKWETGYTYTESDGVTSSADFGVNLGVSAGAHSVVNMSTSLGTGVATGKTKGSNALKAMFSNKGTSEQQNSSVIETNGVSAGYNVSANFGMSFSRSSSVTAQIGKNESISQSYTNYGVKHTLDIIDSQLKRIEESSALGMWEFAAYIISESPVIANNVAHMYLSLTQGEESYLTKAAVNFWDGELEPKKTRIILNSIKNLQHPIFGLKDSIDDEWLMYPSLVTPTTPMSGIELAKALNFPRKSVSGLPVMEVVPFGREPHSLINGDLDVEIGTSYHMRKQDKSKRISISKEELTKHTFITGSTGSGKSNAIYKLLEQLGYSNVKFLVIEPAKGEYKDVLGKKKGVITYGTNPNIKNIPLLRINPFKFPNGIHILEHLDRLIEIFNVCWPMYAAMPAILKDAMERAYIRAGWDLIKSSNKYDPQLFPSFGDVLIEIKNVLDESEYSADNKGDYVGSLVTRIKSLTNGINGIIFTNDDLSDRDLFDRNVIVDLSRVGSTETKSLVMGLLILRLQEYRMENSEQNSQLKHITVLEEAHNILKRTSTEQTTEGANLLGKSVEMLSNAIAEMRTYGEGFIIADQSPGLLDMSVIRNTNTKIILRLPDYSDRELVGRAAGLSDKQIIELSRLEKGVAAISQSDWLEPVLVKVDKYEGIGQPFMCTIREITHASEPIDAEEANETIFDFIKTKGEKIEYVDVNRLRKLILKANIDTTIKCDFFEFLFSAKNDSKVALRKLAYNYLNAKKAIKDAGQCEDITEWTHKLAKKLEPSICDCTNKQKDMIVSLILYEQKLRDESYISTYLKFVDLYKDKGGVF